MLSDVFLFSFSLFVTGVLIFILIYFLITLSDLECDYLNAHECCGKLNFWNVPKLWLQLTVLLLLLLMGHWLLFLVNLPLCIFLGRRFFKIPRGNIGEYDPAEIHNSGRLKKHLVGVGIHLVWQMIGFFLYLYSLLDAIMKEPVDLERDDVEVFRHAVTEDAYEPIKQYDAGGNDL